MFEFEGLEDMVEGTVAAVDLDRGAGLLHLGPHGPLVPAACPQLAATPPAAPREVLTRNICTEVWVELRKGHRSPRKRRKVRS